MNKYRYSFVSICPNDSEEIRYELTIESDRTIMAEKIVSEVSGLTTDFHEDIADILIVKLGGKQLITATHSGVHIETIRGNA